MILVRSSSFLVRQALIFLALVAGVATVHAEAYDPEAVELFERFNLFRGDGQPPPPIRSLVMTGTAKTAAFEMTLESVITEDASRERNVFPTGQEMTMGVYRDQGWQAGVLGDRLLPDDEVPPPLFPARGLDLYRRWREVYGEAHLVESVATSEGRQHRVRMVTFDGAEEIWTFAGDTGALLSTRSTVTFMGQKQESVVSYGDWRAVAGIRVPHRVSATLGNSVVTYDDIRINEGVDEEQLLPPKQILDMMESD